MILMHGTHILVKRKKYYTVIFFANLAEGHTNLAISQFSLFMQSLSRVCTELAGAQTVDEHH